MFGMKKDDPALKEMLHKLDKAMAKRSDQINKVPKLDQPILRLQDARPSRSQIDYLYHESFVLNNPDVFHMLQSIAPNEPRKVASLQGMLYKERGSVLFKQARYLEAREVYMKAIRCTLSLDDSYTLPSPTAFNAAVVDTNADQFWDIVACVNNIAQCYVKENNRAQALEWLEEVHCMYEAFGDHKKMLGGMPMLPWKDFQLNFEEYIATRTKTYMRQSKIWRALGNSAAAYASSWAGFKNGGELLPEGLAKVPPEIKRLRDECDFLTLQSKRHPDPAAVHKVQITDPELQVRGVWKKLRVNCSKGASPASRLGCASVTWKGKYFVFGGQHGTQKVHQDGWALDLHNLDQGWRSVPMPPSGPAVVYHKLALYSDKAYLFQGGQYLSVFDLKTERWSRVQTRMQDGTPWRQVIPGSSLERYGAVVRAGKLFVFGGVHHGYPVGRNVLMRLDFRSLSWKVLSGSIEVREDTTVPGPREHPAIWVVDTKIYVALGDANRSGALISNSPHGGSHDHSYQDIWSWDIEASTWTHEKYAGNTPCLRTEVAYTFNKAWNRAVVFGGYCSSLRFYEPGSKQMLTYTYFGDTFVWSAETKRWSLVISRGFPTYRACGDLITDVETGRTYLFGGYTNTEYTPSSRSVAAQSFDDLWELCIDVPGGGFEESDFEVDPRFSTLGPWKTCFKCGSVGRWMFCAGSCKNTDQAAAFCGTECQKAGWAEHRRQNGCKKI